MLPTIFIHCENLSIFESLKVSLDSSNTIYTLNGIQTFGTPDVLWEHIVFIDEEKLIWSHGVIYGETSNIYSILSNLDNQINNHVNNTDIHVTSANKTIWNNKQDSIDDLSDIRNNSEIAKTSIQSVNLSNGELTVIKNGENAVNYNVVQDISNNDGTIKNGVLSIKTNTPTSSTNKIATISDIEDLNVVKWEDDNELIFIKSSFTDSDLLTVTSNQNAIVFDKTTKRIYLGQSNGKPLMFGSNIIDSSWDADTKTLSIVNSNGNVSNIVLSDTDSGSLLSDLRLDLNSALVNINTITGTGVGSITKTVNDSVNSLNGNAVIASKTNDIVTIKVGINEENGVISNNSNADIILSKIASTGSPNDITVIFDNVEQSLANALNTIKSQIDSAASAGTQYIKSINADNTPSGISANNGITTWNGTLAPSQSTAGKVYLVPTSGTAYTQYITTLNGSTYSWTSLGSTEVSLDGYVQSVTINGKTYEASGVNIILPEIINTITGEATISNGNTDIVSVTTTKTNVNGITDIKLESSIKTVNIENATSQNNGVALAEDIKNYVDSKVTFREWSLSDIN